MTHQGAPRKAAARSARSAIEPGAEAFDALEGREQRLRRTHGWTVCQANARDAHHPREPRPQRCLWRCVRYGVPMSVQ